MIVGTVCLSHSPLKESNRPAPEVEAQFDQALRDVAAFVDERNPDLAVIFYPDHLNGFFYQLLPSFCIGMEGASVGDYGTASGRLDIPTQRAEALARAVLDAGVDVAVSYDMQVDHGAIQALEWLFEGRAGFPIVPVFVNCAAAPLPTFERARALGRAVGDWARAAPERILIMGSGGLSHDPPMASLNTAGPEVRRRLVSGEPLAHAQRYARQSRAKIEGKAMVAGQSSLLPANAKWDRMLLDAFVAGDLSILDAVSDDDIAKIGGRGGHEARAWIAALAALSPGYRAKVHFYEAIDAWITGMGILAATES
ncbi:3-carboxyethylcatechol 2,3-dioxygenase [Sphingobium sp. JS3065]|uniref:3-carboxyethylcatechol 2,3-dioxygenase n=1 Tax=Sphingobium sp. JS3065 TaxID=2970925 RepID=UPI002263D77B|nr:3-carboxyethylcatechol 2,3-dioxygenase [Sphingobium sp. JS3065]UZW57225.1 3-carboxyethylcatechol 2,3-dioxygenase [Sphingobium sp. JS3065]